MKIPIAGVVDPSPGEQDIIACGEIGRNRDGVCLCIDGTSSDDRMNDDKVLSTVVRYGNLTRSAIVGSTPAQP